MKNIRNFLVETTDVKRSTYVWNIIAYTGNSFQSMLLMLVITRRHNMNDAAIFSIAFTAANMLLYIGKYAVRNYQVSDVQVEHTYGDYACARKITMLGMILASASYLIYCSLFKDYSMEKTVCVMLLLGLRFLEAGEDVFHADLQRNGRLDVSSKIWGLRTWGHIVCFGVLYWTTESLLFSAAISLSVSAIMCVLFNYMVRELFVRDNGYDKERIVRLLNNCFPLAVSTFMIGYIGNSPKYAVDAVLSSEEQTCFNIVFMPVFMLALIGNYIYNPLINKLADLWEHKRISEFRKILFQQILIAMLLTGVAVAGGKLFGVRLLGMLYGVDLNLYETEFAFLMLAGGSLTVYNFLGIIATVIRKQKMLFYIAALFSLVFLVGNKRVLLLEGVRAMCLYYAAGMICMSFVTLTLCMRSINRK